MLAEDLAGAVRCAYARGHDAARQWIRGEARPGDTVLIMGARDPDLPRLARTAFASLAARPSAAAERSTAPPSR